jgi:hypothetical protein
VVTGWLFVLAVTGTEPAPWLELVRERGAESCPDGRALKAAVEAELGHPVAAGPRVLCIIARDGRAWRARVSIDGGEQRAPAERTIRANGPDCRPLASALELTLSLALAQAPRPRPEPRVAQVSDGELPDALVARSPPAPWSLSGGAVLSAGALLDLSTGLELGGRWRRGRLLLAFEGRGERPLRAHQGPALIEGWRGSAALVPCLSPGAIQLCGVARAGGFTARGEGLVAARAGRGLLAEAGGRAAWQLGRDDLAMMVYLEAAAPLVRTRLLVDGQPRWRSPPVVVSLGLSGVMGR